MRPALRIYLAIGGLALVAALILGERQRTAGRMRANIAREQVPIRVRAWLDGEHRRLTAAQPTAEELERLRAERAAVAQLQTELANLQRRADGAAAGRRANSTVPTLETPSLVGNSLAYTLWKNAGQASPDAAFETVLWASAGGDVDALVPLLAFDPKARDLAAELFAHLPASTQAEFASPERLIAVLTAKDVPLGRASILGQFPTSTDTKVTAQITDAGGNQKMALFFLRNEDDRWRLVVPENAVKRYAAWLHPPMVTTLPLP